MRSIEIDLRFDGGAVRVKQASGVTERSTATAMQAMLRHLWKLPNRRELVRDLARPLTDPKRRKLIDVYTAYLEDRLDGLRPMDEDHEFATLRDDWLSEFQASASHKHRIRQAFKRLVEGVRHTVKVSDLPTLLEAYRSRCVRENHPRAFNYAKQGVLALLRDRMRRSTVRLDVKDIQGMTEAKQGVLGISVEAARTIRRRLAALEFHPRGAKKATHAMGEEAARIWWAMCCTGMGATEYWGEWSVLPDRVRIRGTKRPGRRWGTVGREVPLVVAPTRPEMSADRFAKILARVDTSPYVARHSFGCWMEDAEIPRTRREMYLGHGMKDVTAKYERREITTFLADDRARLLRLVGTEPTIQLMRTSGLVVAPVAQEA